ncbi:hypothetical protein [Uliginosibacterium sediminicola]|uniref:Uncharacterized protein n=1 Tax=Uliginosibacterium sediminicola TaxID=2024550 RepID=A0ABU9YW02_9RHOO
MTVSTGKILQSNFGLTQAFGAKAINSDFALEIEGFESTWLLAKQAPWPVLTPQGEIEMPGPLGTIIYQPQQAKIALQGQVSFVETTSGSIDAMLVSLLANGGQFNARVYEGTPLKYLRVKKLRECFLQLDNADRDWENRSQPLTFSGSLFFHYFGDDLPGNSTDYR